MFGGRTEEGLNDKPQEWQLLVKLPLPFTRSLFVSSIEQVRTWFHPSTPTPISVTHSIQFQNCSVFTTVGYALGHSYWEMFIFLLLLLRPISLSIFLSLCLFCSSRSPLFLLSFRCWTTTCIKTKTS